MLPQLTLLNGALAGSTVRVPPPPRFRAPSGEIKSVHLRCRTYRPSTGVSAAQKAGLSYEVKVQEYLQTVLGKVYLASPCFDFVDASGPRTCIPDGLFITAKRALIFEIKSQHMPEAWWQLRRLYEPVLRAYLKLWAPDVPVVLLEVCKSFDSQTPFQEKPELVYDLPEFVNTAADKTFGVFRWKP